MPEGPEIRRAADRLSRVLCGQLLIKVYFYSEELKAFEKICYNACKSPYI